jgi:N-acetylglucosaminyl-diphospho-decaprenol L-rhamnosyltransferase
MLAVQIVNYRTRSYLERCLATVIPDLERSRLDHEINLLENASGETLDDLAAEFPRCRVFSSPVNLGFGGGHNLLAAQTSAPYLLILNPDVEFICADTARRLMDALDSDPASRVVGPKLVDPTGAPQPYDHGRLHGPRAQLALRGGHSYWRASDARAEVAWVSGAALLVERASFEAVGGFDQNLFLYKEEEDLCLRIRRAGGRVLYEPSVRVRHHGSVVSDRPQALRAAKAYFFAKHALEGPTHRLLRTAHEYLAYLRR